jgi:hypothetical protein
MTQKDKLTKEGEEKEEFLKEIGTSLYFAFRRKRNKIKKETGETDYSFKEFQDFVDNAVDEMD